MTVSFFVIVLLAIISIAIYIPNIIYFIDIMLQVACGYSARSACNSRFVQSRMPTKDPPFYDELAGIFTYLVEISIEEKDKIVTVRPKFGLRPQIGSQSKFTSDFGCSLVKVNEQSVTPLLSIGNSSHSEPANDEILGISFNHHRNEKLEHILNEQFDDKSLKTRAILIWHDGNLTAERYADGFSSQTPLLGWSMSKSITSSLIGMRTLDGKLNLQDKLYAPEWNKLQNDHRNEITVDTALRMSTGLSWIEGKQGYEDLPQMLYNSSSHAHFAAQKSLQYPPNSHWYYSSGTTNILSRHLRSTFNGVDEAYWSYPKQRLFHALGMQLNTSFFEVDAAGDFVASSYCFLRARDWLKFALLYLRDGIWFDGKRLLPEGFVKYSTTITPFSDGDYAAHWWKPGKKFKSLPDDSFLALGHEEQIIAIIPSRKLVVVRLGITRIEWDADKFLGDIAKAME